MTGLFTAISTGFTAFSATNIDDMVLLTLFFSQVNATLRRWHIIVGQYLGFAALIMASLPAFFGGLIIPKPWIGLFGILPILIGIKCLLDHQNEEEGAEEEKPQNQKWFFSKFINLQIYTVAAVTFANGTDNISIYVPLFASSSWETLLTILAVFFLLVGILCYMAYKLTHNQAIANLFSRYGNQLMPFVLMGLGAFVLLDSGSFTLVDLLFNGELWASL